MFRWIVLDWPIVSEEADGEQITLQATKKYPLRRKPTQHTFFKEIRDVGLEFVPDADLTFIGKKGLLLRVIDQRVEEGILGNAVGREAWEDGVKGTGREEQNHISLRVCVHVLLPLC